MNTVFFQIGLSLDINLYLFRKKIAVILNVNFVMISSLDLIIFSDYCVLDIAIDLCQFINAPE